MKRLLTLVLLGSMLSIASPASAALDIGRPRPTPVPTPEPPKPHHDSECRFQFLDEAAGYSVTEVKRTIRCATWRWWRGHLTTVNYIADRESSFHEHADNPSSSAAGVFQIVAGTWSGWRFSTWASRAAQFKLSTSVYDARSNVLVSIWQMSAYGTGPWSL